jgi:hypothetical protein
MLDWDALQEALQTELLKAVSARAGGPWRVAALDHVYAETDGIITAPSLFLNNNGEHLDSPADWGNGIDDWAPEPWIDALTAEACSGTVSHWDDIFAGYRDVLIRICVAAGAHLGMPVFCVDHDRYEETLARCLPPAQLRALFPEVVARQAERARVSALPPGEQIAHYVSRLNRFDGLINSEEAQKLCAASAPLPSPHCFHCCVSANTPGWPRCSSPRSASLTMPSSRPFPMRSRRPLRTAPLSCGRAGPSPSLTGWTSSSPEHPTCQTKPW